MCKHCWDDWETDHHKDFIRGGVDEDDFGEVKYRKAAKKKPRKRQRCPETDNGRHIYVWSYLRNPNDEWSGLFWGVNFDEVNLFYRREYQVCCGCLHYSGKSRYTKEFKELINKHGWYNAMYRRFD